MRYLKIAILISIVVVVYNINSDNVLEKDITKDYKSSPKITQIIQKHSSPNPKNILYVEKRQQPINNKPSINIFEELDIDRVKETISTKKNIEPFLAIKIIKNSIKKLKKGDKIVLPYIDGVEYEAKVIQKKLNSNGSVSIVGQILDIQDRYSIVLSEGDRYSFGTINLPNKSFEMELINGRGYIYSVKDIDSGWIDYSKDDSIEPSI